MRRFVLPALFVGALFAVLIARRPVPVSQVVGGSAMGTTWTVKVVGSTLTPDRIRTLSTEAIDTVNGSMSTYLKSSELSEFNRNASLEEVKISEALHKVMEAALDVGRRSGGAFDVTLGPVVNAWGFGPDRFEQPPDEETLAEAKARMGQALLHLGAGSLRKERGNIYVDLSAIAKGYAVDAVLEALRNQGVEHAMVEIGGELRVMGQGPGGAWRIGIERPDGGGQDVLRTLRVRDLAVATSGNYRNTRQVGGRWISHTFDGRSGNVVAHDLASVTVFHGACMYADAWATALMALGPAEGLELAKREGVAVLFLRRSAEGRVSELRSAALERLLELQHLDPA